MIMGDENIFSLWWYGTNGLVATIETTPLNWGSMEMGLQREFLGIKREVTNALEFDSTASIAITNARNGNYPIYLTLKRRNNDLTYSVVRTWAGDMETYKKKRSQVSIGFKSSTAREEIEKNKSTKYDIPLGTSRLIYSGIDSDETNIISGVRKRITDSSPLHYSASNWLLDGLHSTVCPASITINHCEITATAAKVLNLRVKLGELAIQQNYGWATDKNNTIQLAQYRGDNIIDRHIWYTPVLSTKQRAIDVDFFATFTDNTYIEKAFNMQVGDKIRLFYNANPLMTWIETVDSSNLRIEVISQEHSIYTDYPVQADTTPTLIAALLAKMCTVPPILAYNLTENSNYFPVLTSAQGLAQTPNPTITVSFEDIMKCLFMIYGADYEVIDGAGDDLTLDIRPMGDLMSNTQAEVLEAVSGIEVTYSDEHVYGTVKVGYETDENAKNGQYDPMCINTFKLGDSDKELDLVCPFKASPTTIEQFIRDKKTSSSTTKDSDTSVFLFCAFVRTDGYWGLFKGHTIIYTPTPYVVNSNYFNLPYSPMRILTKVGRYLKISRWNMDNNIAFISTDRTAQLVSYISAVSVTAVPEYMRSSDLLYAMTTPLFLPDVVDFEALTDLLDKTKINEYPRKYVTITDINSGEVYNVYINDLTLPLTKRKSSTFSGLRKYDI